MAADLQDLETDRKKIEGRLEFEGLLSEFSEILFNIPLPQLDLGIARSLDLIRLSFNGDCCAIMKVVADRRQFEPVQMSWEEGTELQLRALHKLPDSLWIYTRLVEREQPVAFSSLENLPPEALGEREFWETSGIRALLVLPLPYRGEVTHIIALAVSRDGWEWPENYPRRLQLLGRMMVETIIHRCDRKMLQKRDSELVEVRRIANLGKWEWDFIQGKAFLSDEVFRIFGLNPCDFAGTSEAFFDLIHPEDRPKLKEAMALSISNPAKPCNLVHRIVRPDGSIRFVHFWAETSFDAQGKTLRMKGMAQDITERKRAEEAMESAHREIRKLKDRLTAESPPWKDGFKPADFFPDIIGASDPLKYVLYRVRQVAGTKTTVLLMGETGTGKGLFARSLHEASNREDKPFVTVNCAGLPANLIESELFGREKGAFTGSTARQIGRFELAHGGTIFLDEIGELPLDLQSKLLRVIESGEFERLGSPRTIRMDVRIIACTNRKIEEEVKKGNFRRDLFYRLNVFPITIPPLRERKQDIPLLVKYYVEKIGRAHERGVKEVPENVMEVLENYSWPGNVRELINIVQRSVIVSEGPELRLTEKLPSGPSPYGPEESPGGIKGAAKRGLVEIEREHILTTLREIGWTIEGQNGAASLLGINPSTLRSKMKKLGIARPK